MDKQGYTWWPKDWGTSDKVFVMTLEERAVYRELIDLAMLSKNEVPLSVNIWSRKWNTTPDRLEEIMLTLCTLNAIEVRDEILSIPSINKRMAKAEAGRKGGQISKPPSKSGSKSGSKNEKDEKQTPKQNGSKTENFDKQSANPTTTTTETTTTTITEREAPSDEFSKNMQVTYPPSYQSMSTAEHLLPKSIPECRRIYQTNVLAVEGFKRKNGLSAGANINPILDYFDAHVQSEGTTEKTVHDYGKHLSAWAGKRGRDAIVKIIQDHNAQKIKQESSEEFLKRYS